VSEGAGDGLAAGGLQVVPVDVELVQHSVDLQHRRQRRRSLRPCSSVTRGRGRDAYRSCSLLGRMMLRSDEPEHQSEGGEEGRETKKG